MATEELLEFACESCGKKLKAKSCHGGKKAKCPKCGGLVRVPLPERVEEEEVTELSDFEEAREAEHSFAGNGASMGRGGEEETFAECPLCGVEIELRRLKPGGVQRCLKCDGEFALPDEDLGGRASFGTETTQGTFGSSSWRANDSRGSGEASGEARAAIEVTAGTYWSAILSVFGIGTIWVWKYFVSIDGVEHPVAFGRATLFKVGAGSHHVEVFAKGPLDWGKGMFGWRRQTGRQCTLSVRDGQVVSVLYRLVVTPIGILFNGFKVVVLKVSEPRAMTLDEAAGVGPYEAEAGREVSARNAGRFCSECGGRISGAAKFCSACGTRVGA